MNTPTHKPIFKSFEEEIKHFANRVFSIIELVEVSDISEQSFKIIRRKLLNLGNDILRLKGKYKVGE